LGRIVLSLVEQRPQLGQLRLVGVGNRAPGRVHVQGDSGEEPPHRRIDPGLAAALEHCERLSAEHGRSALVVQHSDRLARGNAKDARHLIEVVLWAIKHDVELHSDQDPEMLAGGEMQLLMGAIGGMRNHQDSKRKSLAVKGGMKRRAERGRHNGGPRPYGYVYKDGGLVIHEPEAAIIRRIYAEYLAGRGQREIARDLDFEGIPAQRGGVWHQGTLGNYLSSVLYKGCVHLRGEVYDGEHEAIIDPDTWEQVRQLRAALSRTDGRNRGRYPTGQYLFRKGHLRCSCGESMVPTTRPTRTPGKLYEVYTCYRRMRYGTDAWIRSQSRTWRSRSRPSRSGRPRSTIARSGNLVSISRWASAAVSASSGS
jgi:site-specific DNA recombinase